MQLLAEEVGLRGQENLCSLDLPQIESLCSHFLRRSHYRAGIWAHEFSKVLGCVDDLFQYVFLLWLKW